MNDPIYTIVVILEVALLIWAVKSLISWIRNIVDKQQQISMTKAQAMKQNLNNSNNSKENTK